MPQPCEGQAEFVPQFVERVTADVAECHPLEPPPDALVRIQFWRIAGQWQQLQAFSRAFSEKPLDGVAAMNWCTIPDHEQLARNMA